MWGSGHYITVPLVHEMLDGPKRCWMAGKTSCPHKEAVFLARGLKGLQATVPSCPQFFPQAWG